MRTQERAHMRDEQGKERDDTRREPSALRAGQTITIETTEPAQWTLGQLTGRTHNNHIERWRADSSEHGRGLLKIIWPNALSDDPIMWTFQAGLDLERARDLKSAALQRPLHWGHLTDGRWAAAFTEVQGPRLAEVARRRPLSVDEARAVFTPIAAALADLHAAGLVHNGVQPHNITLTEQGAVLTGLSWVEEVKGDDLSVAERLLREGEAGPRDLLTPPEWLDGASPTPAADIFALAATLLSAVAPSGGGWRDAPPALQGLIAERLSPHPAARGDMLTFCDALRMSGLTLSYKGAHDDEPIRLPLHEVVERVREDELGWHLISAPELDGAPALEAWPEGAADDFIPWGELPALCEAVERARAAATDLGRLERDLDALRARVADLESREAALRERESALRSREEGLTALRDRLRAEVQEESRAAYSGAREARGQADVIRQEVMRETEEGRRALIEARESLKAQRRELEARALTLSRQEGALREREASLEGALSALAEREARAATALEQAEALRGVAHEERERARAALAAARREQEESAQGVEDLARQRERVRELERAAAEARREAQALREAAREEQRGAREAREGAEQEREAARRLRAEVEGARETLERERALVESERVSAWRAREEAEGLLAASRLGGDVSGASRPLPRRRPVPEAFVRALSGGDPGARVAVNLGDLSLNVRFCPAGTSEHGSAEGEGRAEEQPRHPVTLTRPFWLAETPVTQQVWEVLMGAHSSKHRGARLPVEGVSWFEAAAFCNRLSERMGLDPAYELTLGARPLAVWAREANGWRLPTEAEWEHAARAGQDASWRYAGGDDLPRLGWYSKNSGEVAQAVGQKEANAWGLYDLSGGVWEWCQDAWVRDVYRARLTEHGGRVVDPSHYAPNPQPRVIRGGSFYDYPLSCRVAARPALDASGGYGVGLRPLLPALSAPVVKAVG
jgi:sulfatase modifying factor 1